MLLDKTGKFGIKFITYEKRKGTVNMAKQSTYDADSISILEGLEAVRKRPGMYIGSVSTKGLNHLVYEIVEIGRASCRERV